MPMNPFLRALAVFFSLLLVGPPALAWPDKTITVIVLFPPGGSTDTLARAMAAKMQE